MNDPLLYTVLIAVLVTAAVTDLRSSQIPNWLTVPAMVCGIVLNSVLDEEGRLIASLEGLVVGIALFLFFYMTGGMGAGDVKLMAAVGSFLGPIGVLYAGVMTMLIGGIYAAMTMVAHYGIRDSLIRFLTLLTTRSFPQLLSGVPGPHSHYHLRYAVVIGLGTILSEIFIVP
jgi:prepilin peptidase CpaA